jgi:hypothetical protein
MFSVLLTLKDEHNVSSLSDKNNIIFYISVETSYKSPIKNNLFKTIKL